MATEAVRPVGPRVAAFAGFVALYGGAVGGGLSDNFRSIGRNMSGSPPVKRRCRRTKRRYLQAIRTTGPRLSIAYDVWIAEPRST